MNSVLHFNRSTADIDVGVYLRRFFDLEFLLPEADYGEFLQELNCSI